MTPQSQTPHIADPRHLRERIARRERERDEAYLDLIEIEADDLARGKAKTDWTKLDAKVNALKKHLEEVEH